MNVMLCLVWYDCLDFRVVCSKKGLIVIIMLKCYLNATLSIIGHVLFMNFFYKYHCLWLAYPYLFVCVFVVCAMIV